MPDRTIPDPATVPTITVDEAATILGCSRGTAYALVRSGQLPSLRLGRRIVIPTAGLRRYLSIDSSNPTAA
jgi:excisionase family DNA binding protein